MLNKIIKTVLVGLIHAYTAVVVYLLSLVVASPVLLLILAILDVMHNEAVKGRIWLAWLIFAVFAWIPMIIKVVIDAHKKIK